MPQVLPETTHVTNLLQKGAWDVLIHCRRDIYLGQWYMARQFREGIDISYLPEKFGTSNNVVYVSSLLNTCFDLPDDGPSQRE